MPCFKKRVDKHEVVGYILNNEHKIVTVAGVNG
jgi:hypothetical protein